MTGRDRGKTGRVLAVNPAKRTVTVEHAGMIKRHTRANPSKNVKAASSRRKDRCRSPTFLLLCPSCNKGTRLGISFCPTGRKSGYAAAAGTRWKNNGPKIHGESEETES